MTGTVTRRLRLLWLVYHAKRDSGWYSCAVFFSLVSSKLLVLEQREWLNMRQSHLAHCVLSAFVDALKFEWGSTFAMRKETIPWRCTKCSIAACRILANVRREFTVILLPICHSFCWIEACLRNLFLWWWVPFVDMNRPARLLHEVMSSPNMVLWTEQYILSYSQRLIIYMRVHLF